MKYILALFILALLAVTLYAQDFGLEGMNDMERDTLAVANEYKAQEAESLQEQEDIQENILSAFEQHLSSGSQEHDQVEMDAGEDDFDENQEY